jgi:hypothetical protein
MRKASTYLPWSKATGSALLIGVPTYLWAWMLGLSSYVPALGWKTLLVSSLAIPFVFLVWADRSSDSMVLRRAYLTFIGLCLSAVPLSVFLKGYAPWVQGYGLFVAALGAVSLIWQRDRSPYAWQRKALWAFVAASVPSVLGGPAGIVPLHPSLISLSLFMIAGVTLCLTDNDESGPAHSPPRRLASITALLFVLGWLAVSLAPGASSLASWGVRGVLSAVRRVLLEVIKPLSFLVGWLIDLLLRVLEGKKQETESPFNPFERLEPPEQVEEHAPSGVWTFIGWILVAILIVLVLRIIWKLLERYAGGTEDAKPDEIRSSEYSASKAARWAAKKIRELGSPLASMISQRFSRKKDEEPLVAMYGQFLTLAEALGHTRAPSQTPLEFSLSLSEKMPEASMHIERITWIFMSRFYAERAAAPEDLSAMRESLEALESALTGGESA